MIYSITSKSLVNCLITKMMEIDSNLVKFEFVMKNSLKSIVINSNRLVIITFDRFVERKVSLEIFSKIVKLIESEDVQMSVLHIEYQSSYFDGYLIQYV